MGNSKSSNLKDLGDSNLMEYSNPIAQRISLINSYRLEMPVWIKTNDYAVMKGYHFQSKKNIVMKKIAISEESTKEYLNMLFINDKLSHYNIRQVDEAFQTKTHYYITYIYFSGCNFIEYINIKRNIFKQDQLKAFFKNLLETLRYIHNHGIILRNFDPTNVLYDGEDILLTGLSKARVLVTDPKKLKNNRFYIMNYTSAFYKAPEVLDHNYDQRADIWVVGIMLYLAMTESVPFYSTSPEDLIKQIKNEPIDVTVLHKRNVDDAIIELINGMLEKDPNKRLTIDQILANEWFDIKKTNIDKKNLLNITLTMGRVDLKFTILDYLAQSLAKKLYMSDEIKPLKTLFMQIDKNNKGYISKEDMLDSTQDLGLKLTEATINIIFDKFDIDRNGRLEYDQFLAAFISRESISGAEKLDEYFESIDIYHRGFIYYDDVEKTLGQFIVSAADRQLFFKCAGTDRRLVKNEFINFMELLITNQKKTSKVVERHKSLCTSSPTTIKKSSYL